MLYVSPKLNATGYYRMLAPALELNRTSTHKAIITSIEVHDFSKKLDGYVNQLDERLISWADYIVFPTITCDLNYLIQAIQIINPEAQLVMDIATNHFAIRNSGLHIKKITNAKLKQLELNISLFDIITVPNKSFACYLQKMVNHKFEDLNIVVEYIPSLISRLAYEDMQPLLKNDTKKIRIGLIKLTDDELFSLKDVLLKIKKEFKDSVQFVCFGIPRYSKEGDLLLKEIEVELHDTVSFINYFQKLNALKLDMALLPAKESALNTYHNSALFLELSAFGIPSILSTTHTSKPLLKERETGLLASSRSEWIEAIKLLIEDSNYKEQLSRNAIKAVWRLYGYNVSKLNKITTLLSSQ